VPPQVLFGQLLLGLINGSFYALLSLGLAVIFGMLNVTRVCTFDPSNGRGCSIRRV
jgi:branched-subunit amino acid ABC-type transport system permease component